MKCTYCDNEIPAGASRCPSCGAAAPMPAAVPAPAVAPAPVAAAPAPQAAPVVTIVNGYVPTQAPTAVSPKERVVYVLLAVFLGGLGIHNFYAGYTGRAVAQLLISLLTCGYAGLISWVWAIIEACTVKVDAKGCPFR